MKKFLALIFKNVVVTLTTWVVLLVILVFFISSLSSLLKKQPIIKPNSMLVVDLSMTIVDAPPVVTPEQALQQAMGSPVVPSLYLLEVVDAIEKAADDPRISGLFLHGSLLAENYGSGFPVLREISEAIKKFKAKGKPVIAYLVTPTLRDYFLTTSADNLILNPFGRVAFNGLAAELMFFGNALKKYGIGVQTTRVGKYKTAIEMFTQDKMSPEGRMQINALLNTLWDEVLEKVSRDRNLDLAVLQEISDSQGILRAEEALETKMVDELAYFGDVIQRLEQIAGRDEEIESFTQVTLKDYIADLNTFEPRVQKTALAASGKQKETLAVVYAEGEIVDGEGLGNQIGGDDLARELRQLRQDDSVKAVVLRINSPGGSALASEKIWIEVERLHQTKTVVVSMGTYAASGGYWIASPVNTIFAEPQTITGSIGVWGLLPNFKEIANTHGITWDTVKTASLANMLTFSRPKTEEELALIQEYTDFIYATFIQKVSTGRDMKPEAVEAIAQGRVWSGIEAQKIGLVDKLGGLNDAIQHTVELAGFSEDWNLIQIPERRDFSQALAEIFESERDSPLIQKDPLSIQLQKFKSEFEFLNSLNDPNGVYTRLPFNLAID